LTLRSCHSVVALKCSAWLATPPSFSCSSLLLGILPPPRSTLFPYTTLFRSWRGRGSASAIAAPSTRSRTSPWCRARCSVRTRRRSEEHTSELQSPDHLVCRLLLEKKKQNKDLLCFGRSRFD